MSPELHVQKFLEASKDRYTPNIYQDIQVGLKLYLCFLHDHEIKTVHVPSEILNRFKFHLYQDRGHNVTTISKYLRGVRDFYEYLRTRGLIQASPLKNTRLKAPVLKMRYYTNEEQFRAYLAHWRKTYSASRIPFLLQSWKKILSTLEKLNLRLQDLTKEDLEAICCELDLYPSRHGTRLSQEARQRILCVLKKILRWMYRNGYLKRDIAKGFKYHFLNSSAEVLIAKAPVDPLWDDLSKKFFQDVQGIWRPGTIELGQRHMKGFLEYLTEFKIYDLSQIALDVLENYRARIYARSDLAESTKHSKLAIVRYFMAWCEKTGQILINPVHRMNFPKRTRGLPRRLMSPHEVMALMSAPDTKDPIGLRNKALFELMYSTGSRINEAASLKIEDIDFEHGLIRIYNPKGGPEYQRVVPIGKIALEWVKRYIHEARVEFSPKTGFERYLFLSKNGGHLRASVVNCAMRNYAMKQGMRKLYSSHSWRVTCATMMLKNKADIRHVQEQLGHRSLDSTRIYTRLMPMDLKKVHEKTHPREREARRLAIPS